MDPFQAYSAFVRTFEAGSFSAVAREMGTTQSAVSKQIAALERSLAVQLFARTTRRLQPTTEALQLYEYVRQLLDAVESLRASSDLGVQVAGTLRISLPNAYGRHRVCPILPSFLARFPALRLELVLSDQETDLIEEGFELGLRIGELPASTLIARQVDTLEYRLIAAPGYLARHGRPETPVELAAHACLAPGSGGRPTRWEFESEHGRQAVEVTGPLQVNDPQVMFDLACADQGIALVPVWLARSAIESGHLCELLPEFYPLAQRVSLVYPKTRFLTQRARCFIEFLLEAGRAQA